MQLDQDIIRKIKEAGRIGKNALELAKTLVAPGESLFNVAEKTEKYIVESGLKPSFPLNLSINNEAAHYTPSYGDQKVFRTGDVVKIDIGASLDGYCSDNACTLEVGEAGKHSDLIDATSEALKAALKVVRPNVTISKIGEKIEEVILSFGFRPVKNLGGHGIGRYDLHSSIFIPNYDDGNMDTVRPNSLIAIEPFASTGIGMIRNGQPGNIFMLDGPRIDREGIIYREFNTLPFASRWLNGKVNNPDRFLREALGRKEIVSFPVLKEHSGVFISQAEHTILVLSDDVVVTTL
ncbi:MAG: type II methionyl aminopeptidase [Candidatus Thermoplasmatota archaeon]|nr:type II methionyl aminopeptidase [Candidatus Thermoplasmatota archaeon]MCL5731040.1 type II methionyl aminopeptidase [Candidatus Thermoplasmatota archaeon]